MSSSSEETKIEEDVKTFTINEIEKHCTKDDCWIIVGGRVYDVTNFINDHPGGPALLVDNAGRDASDDFEAIGHTKSAKQLMKNTQYIGNVKDGKVIPWNEFIPESKSSVDGSNSTNIIIALIVLLLAVVAAFFTGHIQIPGSN